MLKSGESVTVLAHKVVGMRVASVVGWALLPIPRLVVPARPTTASARYGINSKTKRVSGNITGSNGRGRSRKWVVFFPVSTKVKSSRHVRWQSRRFRYILLVLESHLLHVNDEVGSNSVNEEVANEVAVEIAYFIKRFILFHT